MNRLIFIGIIVFIISIILLNLLPLLFIKWKKRIRIFIISIPLGLLIALIYSLLPPISDKKIATIEKKGDYYIINLTMKSIMINDSQSTSKAQKQNETLILTVPKDNGVIEGKEIIRRVNNNFTETGSLFIGPWKITVDLYINNLPYRWNGDYSIFNEY